jgi:hypothetical protein
MSGQLAWSALHSPMLCQHPFPRPALWIQVQLFPVQTIDISIPMHAGSRVGAHERKLLQPAADAAARTATAASHQTPVRATTAVSHVDCGSSVPFFNSSGSGALIIDADVARSWTGFYRPWDGDPDDADLETDERLWKIDDRFDFEHPVTAYDELSARHLSARTGVLVCELQGRQFLSIANGDDTFGWWPELQLITSNTSRPPAAGALEGLDFVALGRIDVPSGRIWLMNPCEHGAGITSVPDAIPIDVAPGVYLVEGHSPDPGQANVTLRWKRAT